jgi:hypothetical protein
VSRLSGTGRKKSPSLRGWHKVPGSYSADRSVSREWFCSKSKTEGVLKISLSKGSACLPQAGLLTTVKRRGILASPLQRLTVLAKASVKIPLFEGVAQSAGGVLKAPKTTPSLPSVDEIKPPVVISKLYPNHGVL